MKSVAEVKLWNKTVGAVAWDSSKEMAVFEYDKNFLKNDWDISPITMSRQEAVNGKRKFSFPGLNQQTYRGLPGLLSDSLPDRFGNELINVWLVQHGINEDEFDPVQRLCYIGKRGMGALEYEPSIIASSTSSATVNVSDLVDLAKEILKNRENIQVNIGNNKLSEIIEVGSSAGGARAKALIAFNEKTGEVRSGQIDNLSGFEYYILKFDGITAANLGEPEGFGKIEFAYYLMAKAAKIKMMDSNLFQEGKRSHFLTKRFDRINGKKVHVLTLCGIAHYDYNDPLTYSYEQAFSVIRKLKLPYEDKEQLYRRMVFNVLAQNNDDHTKNISFLMDDKGDWRLAPAYDITFAYKPSSLWLKQHQLSINGQRINISKSDMLELAINVGVKKADDTIEEVLTIIKKWKKYADQANVNKKHIEEIDKLIIKNL